MDNDKNQQSSSENSSDEDLVEQLKKAGLKITRKRKCTNKNTQLDADEMINSPKKPKATTLHAPKDLPAANNQLEFYSNLNDKKKKLDLTKNSDSIDIENLPIIEKIGDHYFKLNTEIQPQTMPITLLDYNVPFTIPSKQSEKQGILMCAPIAPLLLSIEYPIAPIHSPSFIEASAANDETLRPDVLPEDLIAPIHSPSLIEAPSANDETLRPDVLRKDPIAPIHSPSLIEAPAVSDETLRPDALPEDLIAPIHSPSLIEVPASNDETLRPYVLRKDPIAPIHSPSLIEAPAVNDENLRPDVLPEDLIAPIHSPSLIEAPAVNDETLRPDVLSEDLIAPIHSPSLIEAPAANDETLRPDVLPEDHIAPIHSPSLIEAPAANDETLRPDVLPEDHIAPIHSPSLIEAPAANQDSPRSEDESTYHGDMTQNRKRNKKATMDPMLWTRNKNKEKRAKGESYLGYRRDKNADGIKFKVKHDVYKPARSMKPPCTSSFCIKSKLRACDNISPEARQKLFTTFWKTMSWEQRRSYICSHVLKVEKKVTKNTDSKRTESRAYYLTIENNRYQVCKKMFLATLGIKEWFVRYWLEKTDCAMPPDNQESQRKKKGPEKNASKDYLVQFFTKLPKMPSHYCRQSTSKLYLEPIFDNMTELYKVYKNACEVDSQQCLGIKLFSCIFDKQNLALFRPKKDQCDLCCSYKVGNISEEEYNTHITKKNRARAEKATDKLFAQTGTCHVFTQDVESVKLLPFLQASAIYYKTKLCVHNFTIYNLATHEVFCYWFDETNSSLEASVFASCLVEYVSKVLDKKFLPVVLYSDGCCAQNRNAILSNALLRLSIEKKVVISQKYLEKGHTQMECDSVHSSIECKVKGKEIYLPDQYVQITKKARTNPIPYDGKLLDFSFFTDFSKDLIYKSIRPGKKTGDPVVTDIRMLEYRPDGIIRYKTSFDHDLKPLPLRPKPLNRIKAINDLPKLYKGRLSILRRKYQDLQDLKTVIPEPCHAFYDQLPHKD